MALPMTFLSNENLIVSVIFLLLNAMPYRPLLVLLGEREITLFAEKSVVHCLLEYFWRLLLSFAMQSTAWRERDCNVVHCLLLISATLFMVRGQQERERERDYFRRRAKQVLTPLNSSSFSWQIFPVNKTGWGLANPVLSRTDACCEDFGSFFI